MLLLTSAAYCAESYQKTSLRIPLDFNNKSAASDRWQDALRAEDLRQLKTILNDPFLDLDEETIDFIIQDISKRGGLFIDEDGAIHGSKSILRMISGMRKVTLRELLQESLFHEGVHKLLQLILYSEPKKLFLQEIGEELGAGYSFRSASLKDDVITIMREVFGEFKSENECLEELIAKYYTYEFCDRDADIFNLSEMQRAGSIIELSMKKRYYGVADDAERTKKNLDGLFSIKGEKTKKARIAKLNELSRESEEWGGKFNITFKQRDEAVARLDKALGQLFLKNYPIIPVFRRMRHGGSVYDMEHYASAASTAVGQILYYGEIEGLDGELKVEFENFLSALKDKYVAFQELIREPSAGVESEIEKPVILKWEDGLRHNLEVFRKTRSDFDMLVKKASQSGLNDEMDEVISTFSEMAGQELDKCIVILTEGVNLINGVVVKKEADLNELIEETIKSRGSFVEFKKEPGLKIYADPMMVRQIITNIVFNIDIIKTEKQITKATINARLSEDGGNVIIEIIDNGLGFPEGMLSKTPRSDGSYEVIFGLNTTYRKDGSGFGLAENDLYAKLNNGSFQIFTRSSGEQRGSTFIIRLPVSKINEQLAQETEAEIVGRMNQHIFSLMALWDANHPLTYATGQELSLGEATAERILKFFFKDDKISNKLGIVTNALGLSLRTKKYSIYYPMILNAIEACSEVINRLDNTLLTKLQDDAELKEYTEYFLQHPKINQGSVTEEGTRAMGMLEPEQVRSMVKRYIDELKPVIASLKEDLNKLMQISPGDTAAIEQIKELQTSL